MSHAWCSHICMCLNTVAGSIMLQLYLQCDFYNLIFQTKRKLYIASGSSPLNEYFCMPTCLCLSRKSEKFCHSVCPYIYIVLVPTLTKPEFYVPNFSKISRNKIWNKMVRWVPRCSTRTDMTKPVVHVTFHICFVKSLGNSNNMSNVFIMTCWLVDTNVYG
jgi:hypothetical protein